MLTHICIHRIFILLICKKKKINIGKLWTFYFISIKDLCLCTVFEIDRLMQNYKIWKEGNCISEIMYLKINYQSFWQLAKILIKYNEHQKMAVFIVLSTMFVFIQVVFPFQADKGKKNCFFFNLKSYDCWITWVGEEKIVVSCWI